MEQTPLNKYLVVGDIGGTNCRLELIMLTFSPDLCHKPKVDSLAHVKHSTNDLPNLHSAINNFTQKIIADQHILTLDSLGGAVIGIAGPVFGGVVTYQLNIKHWCPVDERVIERETGLKRVVLLNDFVANGYGVIDLDKSELKTIYEPKEIQDDSVKYLIGIGTGFGSCQLTREPSKVATVKGNYHVNACEAGMIRLPTYSEKDLKFFDYLRNDLNITDRDDAQLLFSGPGLLNYYRFLTKDVQKSSLKLNPDTVTPSEITTLAQFQLQNFDPSDNYALRTVQDFLLYLAQYLADLSCVFMPLGGILMMSTVVYSTQFILDEDAEFREKFVKTFQESRGAGMADYLKKIPLQIVKSEENIAHRGCIQYAIQNGLLE